MTRALIHLDESKVSGKAGVCPLQIMEQASCILIQVTAWCATRNPYLDTELEFVD